MRAAVAAAMLAAVAVPATADPRPPRTLLTATGPITAFARSANYVSWATLEPANPRCSFLIRVRDRRRGYQTAVNNGAGETCTGDLRVTRLALSGAEGRVLWLRRSSGNNQYYHLSTASLREPRERRLEDRVFPSGDDSNVSALFGDTGWLGYAWYDAGIVEEGDCFATGNCPFRVRGGGAVWLGTAEAQDIPPAVYAAIGGGRIAFVSRGAVGTDSVAKSSLRTVEVRSIPTRVRIGRVTARRPIRAIAVSRTTLAVLTDRAIERYSVFGARLGVTPVPDGTAPELGVWGSGVVYRVGLSIRTIADGEIAHAAGQPIGLTFDGGHVSWAENVRSGGTVRGRVRTLVLR